MSRVDEAIIQALSSGKKRFSELKIEIVDREICANQTLVNHLKKLEQEGIIQKEVLGNRNTVYSINPKYTRKISDIVEISKLTSLLDRLQDTIINEDLQLVKLEQGKSWTITDWLLSQISKNRPKIKYSFYTDSSSLNRLKYFVNFEEIATKFRSSIIEEFHVLYNNIPPIMDTIPDPIIHSNWDSSLKYAEQLGKKHDFSFLLYSYFDGINYNRNISKALKKLDNLKKGKDDWIFFLDEIGLRTHYAWQSYYTEGETIQLLFEGVLDQISFEALGEICFIGELFGWGASEFDVLALDAAITSEYIKKMYNKFELLEYMDLSKKEKIPYNLLKKEDFIKMKYGLIENEIKIKLIKNSFEELKYWLTIYGKDGINFTPFTYFASNRKDDPITVINKIKENMDFYYEEINSREINDEVEISQYNQIFNFKYKIGNKILDLNGEPKVQEFKSFIDNPKKRDWLQQCLNTGIPIWTSIPFKKLGFQFETIL